MKNFVKIFAALLAISMITAVFTACGNDEPGVKKNSLGETYYTNIATIITYKVDGQNINTQVNEDKSLVFQGIFNDITECEKKPDCKFSKDFMVTYKDKEYQIAQDGCNNVMYEGKYYQTTVSDRMILNDIFEEYGAVIKDQEID